MLRHHFLLLGGTEDARGLADAIHHHFGDAVRLTYSLAGLTKNPALPANHHAMNVRMGGFGGVSGLTDFLRTHDIDMLINAVHPFAVQISKNAKQSCAFTQTAYLRALRAPWQQDPLASPPLCWQEADNFAQMPAFLENWQSQNILLMMGVQACRDLLTRITQNPSLSQCHYVLRAINPPDPALLTDLPLHFSIVTVTPPHSASQEKLFFQKHHIDTLILRNSGAPSGWQKLRAACAHGLNILMLRAPYESESCQQIPQSISQIVKWRENQKRF